MENKKIKKEQTKTQVDPETKQRLIKLQESFKLTYKGINSLHTGRPGKFYLFKSFKAPQIL